MTAPVVLTCGEPAGVGPELSFSAWQTLRHDMVFFLIADLAQVARVASGRPFKEITDPQEAAAAMAHGLPVLNHRFPELVTPGQPMLENAPDVINVIRRGVDMVDCGKASAICTNPIHKKILKDGADFPFPGHTEFLAHLAGSERSVMMMTAPGLRVVPVTIHVPLSQVVDTLTPALLEETIRTVHEALVRDFGIENPRITVAGLNPHSGEGGTMGKEEKTLIGPVLHRLRADGHSIIGPLPSDTIFHAEARARYDVAICMYHDQALIPLKAIDFHGGVNVTLGLHFVRTSPDHGTALDIAGKGVANPSSLIAALRQAHEMSRAQHEAKSG
ncbi:MAG: 4-hydroxythreonine-4-phosphate dehydrogenase PdxA [Paracoccaceae bacterium]